MNGKRETQPRGNCRETSAGRSAEVKGQDLRRSCPIDRCLGSYLSPLASRVRWVDPDPRTKPPLCLKNTPYLVVERAAPNRNGAVYSAPRRQWEIARESRIGGPAASPGASGRSRRPADLRIRPCPSTTSRLKSPEPGAERSELICIKQKPVLQDSYSSDRTHADRTHANSRVSRRKDVDCARDVLHTT